MQTGVFGRAAPNDCLMIFFLDRLESGLVPGGIPDQLTTNKVNRELQVEVHMAPVQFKSFASWMADHVRRYEENFGEIVGQPKEYEEENPLVQ